MTSYEYSPLRIFNKEDGCNFVLIILNAPLNSNLVTLQYLWKKASYRICVDGGTNLITNLIDNGQVSRETIHMITGDFDSIDGATLDKYKHEGVIIRPTPDQDETDFTKCLRIIFEDVIKESPHLTSVVVFGEQTGRFDHIMANINTLYKYPLCRQCCENPGPSIQTTNPCTQTTDPGTSESKDTTIYPAASVPIYLFGHNSCTFALCPSIKHCINIDHSTRGDYCGILPIGNKCNISTSGFKWDMDDTPSEFGSLVSSSNAFSSSTTITVCSSQTVLFTMDLKVANVPRLPGLATPTTAQTTPTTDKTTPPTAQTAPTNGNMDFRDNLSQPKVF